MEAGNQQLFFFFFCFTNSEWLKTSSRSGHSEPVQSGSAQGPGPPCWATALHNGNLSLPVLYIYEFVASTVLKVKPWPRSGRRRSHLVLPAVGGSQQDERAACWQRRRNHNNWQISTHSLRPSANFPSPGECLSSRLTGGAQAALRNAADCKIYLCSASSPLARVRFCSFVSQQNSCNSAPGHKTTREEGQSGGNK